MKKNPKGKIRGTANKLVAIVDEILKERCDDNRMAETLRISDWHKQREAQKIRKRIMKRNKAKWEVEKKDHAERMKASPGVPILVKAK